MRSLHTSFDDASAQDRYG